MFSCRGRPFAVQSESSWSITASFDRHSFIQKRVFHLRSLVPRSPSGWSARYSGCVERKRSFQSMNAWPNLQSSPLTNSFMRKAHILKSCPMRQTSSLVWYMALGRYLLPPGSDSYLSARYGGVRISPIMSGGV